MSIEKLVDKNIECIICFDLIDIEKLVDKNIEIFKECDHNNNYHNECINMWVNECINENIYPSCPICRKDLQIININNSISEQNNQTILIQNEEQRVNLCTHNCCCICCISIIISIIIFGFFKE